MGDEPVEHDPRDGEAARREDSTVSEDATLRRLALDPAIPRDARDLLRARGEQLALTGPVGRRRLLPAEGEKREATVSTAVTGLTTALFVAVVGATPWAVGVLVFQQPVAWQSAAGRYGLLLAELIIAVTAIAFGTRVAGFGEPRVEDEAVSAARMYRGRYLTEADLDAHARVLLRRAQDAVHAINSAEIVRADLLDEAATSALLAEQEWQIALAVREQARLRALRSGLAEPRPGSPAAELLDDHRRAARAAEQSTADLDARARVLLRRAQDAVHAINSAEIVRADLLDEPATSALLAEQEWQIALAVREQARLRALRSGLAEPRPGSPAAELLDDHRRAARAAEQSTADRVAALERYATEVHGADAAYRDWRQHAAIAELTGQHLDLLARTAADDHGITELGALTQRARALRRSFTETQD